MKEKNVLQKEDLSDMVAEHAAKQKVCVYVHACAHVRVYVHAIILCVCLCVCVCRREREQLLTLEGRLQRSSRNLNSNCLQLFKIVSFSFKVFTSIHKLILISIYKVKHVTIQEISEN